ncbi:Sulfate adenylyltransferase [Perkinsus chesapeaki]|uniref:sulfate adenylyltransferase n=1 Tax=Perkinsus chesapeaki TaxID=330153 RepID=A0A7J6M3A0_PERCH|nr:Sulfate adenylyltransferase [Perkinsus chesapeaki]
MWLPTCLLAITFTGILGSSQPCRIRHQLNERQVHDLELLLVGGFAPLDGFMTSADYESVVHNMRLADGQLWPLPVTLDTNNASKFTVGSCAALLDTFGNPVARLEVSEVWRPNKTSEALECYGTLDRYDHPAVKYLLGHSGEFYVGGKVHRLRLPDHWDLGEVRKTPEEVRNEIIRRNWTEVVAFQTRNPMHFAHVELVLRALQGGVKRGLLLHPVVGPTKADDVPYGVRFKCYEKLLSDGLLPSDRVILSALPLTMRLGGPREAVLHAIVRRNYGATHFIVGRDHAGCKDATGKDFYEPFAAAELTKAFEAELGVEIIVPEGELVHVTGRGYIPVGLASPEEEIRKISGTQMRAMLDRGEALPSWFTPPGVAEILRRHIAPIGQRGFAILVSGRSGSGKTTLAKGLKAPLEEARGRVTILDGDQTRQLISSGLTHSRADRLAHAARMGFIAGEVVKHRGVVLLSLVAPYRDFRQVIRDYIVANGGSFIHVHMNTSQDDCATRDRKDIYQANQVDDYEVPSPPESVDLFLNGIDDLHYNINVTINLLHNRGHVPTPSVTTAV